MTITRLAAADETPFPVDLPEAPVDGRRPLAWTIVAIAIATLSLAIANAKTLHDWAVELEPGPVQARLAALTERWEVATAPLGAPRAWLHARWTAAQARRF